MMLISGGNIGALLPLTTSEKILEVPKVQKSGENDQPLSPVMDEYIPEEKREPSGRYWMGKDEDGQPKIYFDDPERAADAPGTEEPEPDKGEMGPEKKGGEKEELCSGNTGKVDREIEKLKKKLQELKQQLNTETDEAKIKDLERQLTQVERELKQKDNDTYRKQHSTFTQLS